MKAFKLTHTSRATGIYNSYKSEEGLKRLFGELKESGSRVWCDNDYHRLEAKSASEFVAICEEGNTFVYLYRGEALVNACVILVENIELD